MICKHCYQAFYGSLDDHVETCRDELEKQRNASNTRVVELTKEVQTLQQEQPKIATLQESVWQCQKCYTRYSLPYFDPKDVLKPVCRNSCCEGLCLVVPI
jgi:hypothetical protein